MKCGVTAKDVRLLYWPIGTDAKNATSGSTMMTTTSTPSGYISNGYTLSVRAQTQSMQADFNLAPPHLYT